MTVTLLRECAPLRLFSALTASKCCTNWLWRTKSAAAAVSCATAPHLYSWCANKLFRLGAIFLGARALVLTSNEICPADQLYTDCSHSRAPWIFFSTLRGATAERNVTWTLLCYTCEPAETRTMRSPYENIGCVVYNWKCARLHSPRRVCYLRLMWVARVRVLHRYLIVIGERASEWDELSSSRIHITDPLRHTWLGASKSLLLGSWHKVLFLSRQ